MVWMVAWMDCNHTYSSNVLKIPKWCYENLKQLDWLSMQGLALGYNFINECQSSIFVSSPHPTLISQVHAKNAICEGKYDI